MQAATRAHLPHMVPTSKMGFNSESERVARSAECTVGTQSNKWPFVRRDWGEKFIWDLTLDRTVHTYA